MAEAAEPFIGLVDPDDSSFFAPGDMPKRINDYLVKTGQNQVDEKGQMIRLVLESLALKYREIMENIEAMTGNSIDILHIVGGSIQNELLCPFTANALGKKVITGPIEGTAIGNILMQAKAAGQIDSLSQARKILRNSIEIKEYEPVATEDWQKQYQKIY